MIKKGLFAIVCLAAMSAMVAWGAGYLVTTYAIQTRITSPTVGTRTVTFDNSSTGTMAVTGGTIKVRSNNTQYSGIKYSNFTTSAAVRVVVAPEAGYKIISLTKKIGSGAVSNIAFGAGTAAVPVDLLKDGTKTQVLSAAFAHTTGSDTVEKRTWQLQTKNNNAGGYLTITRGSDAPRTLSSVGQLTLKNYPDTTPVTIQATALTGYDVDKVLVNGAAATLDAEGKFTINPTTATKLQTVIAYYTKEKYSVTATAVTGGQILIPVDPKSATYTVAYQGQVQVNVNPTGANNLVTGITVTGGGSPTLTMIDNAGKTSADWTGPVKVNISNITAPVVIGASFGKDTTAAMEKNCMNSCHLTKNAAGTAFLYPEVIAAQNAWLNTRHNQENVDCVSCHQTMPGPAFTTASAQEALCATCHAPGGAAGHPVVTGNQSHCFSCHSFGSSHNPVRSDVPGTVTATCAQCHTAHDGGNAFLKAQYQSNASRPISCADCHSTSQIGPWDTNPASAAIQVQFAGSAHGDTAGEAWIHYDWRSANRSSCARCHTGTGFVAKLGNENDTSNAFQTGDILKPGETLACSACHSDAGTGALRDAARQFTINLKNGATVTYDVAGASALCARCHSGRETGASIKADADATGVRPFVDSHYQPVAGTLYNSAGYEYAGQDYDGLGDHKLLGATGEGPCVSCHMAGKNHSLVAVGCNTCHNGVTAAVVNAANLKASYDAALNNLKLALQAKGIHYGAVHPYFFTAPYVAGAANTPFTNWGSVYGAGKWKDTMGAAFNYNLLWSEKGAYAHNYGYAMKLIADSVDFLNDGGVDGH